jgi:hypothetical protein
LKQVLAKSGAHRQAEFVARFRGLRLQANLARPRG